MNEKTTRESMVFYNSFYEAIKHLPAEEFKKSACAIFEYGFGGEVPDTYGIEYSVFTLVKLQIDTNNKRWNNAKKSHCGKKSTKTAAVKEVTPTAVIDDSDIYEDISAPDYCEPEEQQFTDGTDVIQDEDICENEGDYAIEEQQESHVEASKDKAADTVGSQPIPQAIPPFPICEQITSSHDFKSLSSIAEEALKIKSEAVTNAPKKAPMGEYNNVFLTPTEKANLVMDYGFDKFEAAVEFLSRYLKRKPHHHSACHYEDIRGWVMNAMKERQEASKKAGAKAESTGKSSALLDFDLDDFIER